MATSRISAWLITEKGRKFTYFATGTTAVAILFGKTLPHTLFLDKYKDIVHMYKNGFTVPLPKEFQTKVDKALDLIETSEYYRDLFKPFSVCGFDIFSAGTSYSRFGVIIGIPVNFTYKSADMIDKSYIKLRNESIPWELEEGKLLLNSFILSENAQLYAIAREIKMRDSPKFFFDTFHSLFAIMGTYFTTTHLNQKFNLYSRPLILRVILYALTGTFFIGNYFFLKDITQVYYEKSVDEFLKSKSPIFIEGGREFYDKILQRNIASRQLLGKEGEYLYTALGNENYWFRHKHLPLVQRKSFFEQQPQVS